VKEMLRMEGIVNGEEEEDQEEEKDEQDQLKSFTLETSSSLVNSGSKVSSNRRQSSSGKKYSVIHKPLAKTPSKSFIHIGHDNWNLVLHMMLGAR
jgi:hypothetical protein